MGVKTVSTLRQLKRTKTGRTQRIEIAKRLKRARAWDRKKQWLSFGEWFNPSLYAAVTSRIKHFLANGVKVVRILDLGGGSGKYWEQLINWDTRFKGKIQVICLNPTKKSFRNSKTKRVVTGSLATLNESRLNHLLSGGKFHFVMAFLSEAHNPLTEELLLKRVRRVLVEPDLKKFFITEESID